MSPVKTKKNTKSKEKTKDKPKTKNNIETSEDNTDTKDIVDVEAFPIKGKKGSSAIIDDHPEVDAIEEKIEDEVIVKPEDVEDLLADELTLDDDDINPFGDKWEE